MADIMEVGIAVDTSGLNKGEVAFASMVNKIINEQKRQAAAAKASTDVQIQAMQRLVQISLDAIDKIETKETASWAKRQKTKLSMMVESEKMAQREAKAQDAITAAIIRQEAAIAQAARTKASNYQSGLNANLGIGSSAVDNGAGYGAIEAELERLKLKYDSAYAAGVRLESELDELNMAHLTGAISTEKHRAAVDALQAEFQQFSAGTATLSNRFVQYDQNLVRSSKNVNRFGMVTQQVGYQVGDFFVQMMSGTNVLVAFGQQATQLTGLLKNQMAGAVLGIGISLASMLGAMWMRSNQATKGVDNFDQSLKNLKSTAHDVDIFFAQMRLGLGSSDEAEAQLGIQELEKKLKAAQDRLSNLIKNPTGNNAFSFWVSAEQVSNAKEAVKLSQDLLDNAIKKREQEENYKKTVEATQNVMKKSVQTAADWLQSYVALNKSSQEEIRTQQQLAAISFMSMQFGEKSVAVARLKAQIARDNYEAEQKAKIALVLSGSAAQVLLTKMMAAYDAANLFSNLNISSGVWSAAEAAAQLAQKLGIALATAQLLVSMGTQYAPGHITSHGGRAEAEYISPLAPRTSPRPRDVSGVDLIDFGLPDAGGGGGGGGSDKDPMADILKEIERTKSLLDLNKEEKELKEEIWRIEDSLGEARSKYSTKYIEGLAKENLALQEQKKTVEENQQKMEGLAKSIDSSMEDTLLGLVKHTESFADSMKSLLASVVEELYKVLVIQQMVGSIGAGSGLVGLLTGSGGSGGGLFGGNSWGSVPARAGGGPVDAGQPYLVGEKGPELIVPRSSGTVMTAQQTAGMGGGSVTVENHITVTGSDSEAVKVTISQMLPQIVEATKLGVMDANGRKGFSKY